MVIPDSLRPEESDTSLLRRFRRGDQDAATEIYLRYARRLQAIAAQGTSGPLSRRVDTEGVVQSVFRTFFRRVSRGEYDAVGQEDLWRLLLVIALNKVRKLAAFHRSQKRDIGRTERLESWAEADDGTEEFAMRILEMTIDDLTSGLSASSRSIVKLRLQGYTVAEIASRLSRSKRSVERVLHDFRKKLAPELEQHKKC